MLATDWHARRQNAPNDRHVSRKLCSPCRGSLVTKRWNSSANVADEREVGAAPGPVRIVEHRLEEQALERDRDQVVETIPGGLEEHEGAGAVARDETGEDKAPARGASRGVARLAAEVQGAGDGGSGEVGASAARRCAHACELSVRVRNRRPVAKHPVEKVASLAVVLGEDAERGLRHSAERARLGRVAVAPRHRWKTRHRPSRTGPRGAARRAPTR